MNEPHKIDWDYKIKAIRNTVKRVDAVKAFMTFYPHCCLNEALMIINGLDVREHTIDTRQSLKGDDALAKLFAHFEYEEMIPTERNRDGKKTKEQYIQESYEKYERESKRLAEYKAAREWYDNLSAEDKSKADLLMRNSQPRA